MPAIDICRQGRLGQVGRGTIAGLLAVLMIAESTPAQTVSARVSVRAFAANIVVPQRRTFSHAPKQSVEIAGVKVGVVVLDQVATTTMDISLNNPTTSQQEAEILLAVPDGAVVRGFDFQGKGSEPSAELLPRKQALATYQAIVAKLKDPALLEFAGYNLIRSSVFPVPARGTQKVRLTYEHLLPSEGHRVDYLLPRTESLDATVPWEMSLRIKSKKSISTVYSPSHKLSTRRASKHDISVKLDQQTLSEPGPVQLSFLHESDQAVTASLFAYPDPKRGGGYFLLLAGLPADATAFDDGGRPLVKREVTLVIDRSGSMAGDKLEQAKAAALQVLEGLYEGEAFNIIDYSDSISSFAPQPVLRTRKSLDEARHYVRRLRAAGGTNIHDTLVEALRPKPRDEMLPFVLFLTDGLPTVGVRDEVAIRNAVVKSNTHQRRIFTFGVGYDVNAPLLTHVASNSRATSTFVLPNEEIEAKVSQVYNKLFGPVVAAPRLSVVDKNGQVNTRRVSHLEPTKLGDLFEGDKLVVLGQYEGDAPLEFRLKGKVGSRQKTFRFRFKLDSATPRNSFVARLWASRRIARLVDEIRQAGAEQVAATHVVGASPVTDPKMKELVDEVVRLSLEFGILTEYTAFLAKEGTDLAQRNDILREANQNLVQRAQMTRGGIAAVNQAYNINHQEAQTYENRRNCYWDANMKRVQIARVQQLNDRAYFQRGSRWIDGRAINHQADAEPDQVVTVGSPEFEKLVREMVANHCQAALAIEGEVLLRIGDRNVLIRP